MSQSETAAFLVDLLARFDASLDLTEGSRAQSELVEPILARIGGDPFDDDIQTFLRTRVAQVRPDLAITEVDELTDVVLDPMRVLLEPITREIQLVKLRTSLNNIASLADAEVDALMANFFESRKAGGYAVGTVRAYFAAPQSVSVTLIHIAQTKGGYRYVVPRPQAITADQMLLNVEGSEYYFDINYVSEARGDEYNIERGEINTIANLAAATRITNLRAFRGGVARETNEAYVARVQQGTSDKTLTTAPGIIAVLKDNFPALRQLYEVGYGDPEMQRDVMRGGSLGAIPTDDDLGSFFGRGAPVDDLDADGTSPLLEAQGHFVTRVAAAGAAPDGWYITLSYSTGVELVVKDVAVLEVVSDTRIRIDHEMPLTLTAEAVVWMLRRKLLTISDIPGGIALPDAGTETLSVPSDVVHIGGKTDIYVSGAVEDASAQITGLSDEKPLARGFRAQTQGTLAGFEDVVVLADIDADLLAQAAPGMSLVLSAGTDVGAYRIVEVRIDSISARIDTKMTGAQSNLTWKIVDEIDVDLTDPKDVLVEGADLILAAGSAVAIAASGINWQGAGVRDGDVLFVDDPDYGGNFSITDATATQLTIDPVAPRALSGVHFVVSRKSEGVLRPVVRIKALELLDSAGAPNGTVIPYRDPVLALSKAFQNESTGYLYDGPVFAGLLTLPWEGVKNAEFQTLIWQVRSPALAYGPPSASGTFTFGVPGDVAALAAQLNANTALRNEGVRAVVVSYAGQTYLGLTSQKHITLTGGSALATLGFTVDQTNGALYGGTTQLAALKIRRGDLVAFVSGANNGLTGRIVTEPSAQNRVLVGTGPLGPVGTEALYDPLPLSPDAGGRVRIARPSVGSVRVFFLDPTSIDFDYHTTRFSLTLNGQTRTYQPDPENTRVVVPPPPTTTLPTGATTDQTARTLTHADTNFLSYGLKQGDLLDVLYRPIEGTTPLPASTTLNVGGRTLVLQLDTDPFITVSFPYAMTPEAVVSYVNEQTGTSIAKLENDRLILSGSRRIEVIPTGTAQGMLGLTVLNNDHPAKGTYVVQSVTDHTVTLSARTPMLAGGVVANTFFRVRRYLQRCSATEMAANVDVSGLYYADVEAVATAPGDAYNIGADLEMLVTGYKSDGYRLTSAKPELSFSRAEELRAELSRTLLLVGASDNPVDYVQLNLQNVQVSYERSTLVDDVQSFCASRYRRVVCEDILVRHLFPHFVSLNWRYAGGPAEPEMTRALIDYLAGLEGGDELEVGALRDILSRKQATSVFAVDAASATGRTAPVVLVVRHDADRQLRASLVRDIVSTVRTCTYLPDSIVLRRLSASGVR